jgi:oligopeptidase A
MLLQASLDSTPTWESVLDKMEQIRAPLEYAWGVVGHLNGVKNSEPLRKAYQAMQPEVVQAFQAMGQSKPVFEALKQLQANSSGFTEAQQRIIESSVRQVLILFICVHITAAARIWIHPAAWFLLHAQ